MSQSRRKRIRHYNEPGHAHELTFSCFRNIPLLDTEQTCCWLAQSIDAARRGHQFQLWGYVFMPEHVHLMVWPVRAQYSIARVLLSIKLPMARKALAYLRKTRSGCAYHLRPYLCRQVRLVTSLSWLLTHLATGWLLGTRAGSTR